MLNVNKFKVYAVGGYVRDRLMNRPITDHDFVVVGATPQDMLDAGFNQVGADFPVFLSPITGDEFALARTERKVGSGYHGFEVTFNTDVTLEEDLIRRDLTVNAMAREVIGWNDLGHAKLSDVIIDPFNGQQDLKEKTLRHTSNAFKDDPVRLLRVCRFKARYNFEIAEGTMQLMKKLVSDGELNTVTKERVWQEFNKAMSEPHPHLFFESMKECGALSVVVPQLDNSEFSTLAKVEGANLNIAQRFMVLCVDLEQKVIKSMFDDLKAPIDLRDGSMQFARWVSFARRDINIADVHEWANVNDVWRKNRFEDFSSAVMAFSSKFHDAEFDLGDRIVGNTHISKNVLEQASNVGFDNLTQHERDTLKGRDIGLAISRLRLAFMQSLM